MVITNNLSNKVASSDNIIAHGVYHSKGDANIPKFLIEAENKEASSKSSPLLCSTLSHAR